MFEKIDRKIKNRMMFLEDIDRKDREDGTPRRERLRQIPPETGKFISMMAAGCPEGTLLEIGTSAGYSTLWLVLAAAERGTKIKTFEILPGKIKLARETFRTAGVEDYVELIEGDALEYLREEENTAFCFLDAEKEIYGLCWEILSDKIVPGGFLIADNAINHRKTLHPMIEETMRDPRFDSMIVPVGKGELVCRRKKDEDRND